MTFTPTRIGQPFKKWVDELQVWSSGSLIPKLPNTYDLGSSTLMWRKGHLSQLDAGTISVGTSPASAGIIRIPNNQWIAARNAANNADVNLIKLGGGNWIDVGAPFQGPIDYGNDVGSYQIRLVRNAAPAHTYGFAVEGGAGGLVIDDITNAARRVTIGPTGGMAVAQGFGCNGKGAQTPYASGGTLAGVVAALVANGILST